MLAPGGGVDADVRPALPSSERSPGGPGGADLPELARFYGIVIRMYSEAGETHHRSHFHAFYQEHVAVYSIDPVLLMAGRLPLRQQRLVEAWAELHRRELADDWRLLLQGRAPRPIAPLR